MPWSMFVFYEGKKGILLKQRKPEFEENLIEMWTEGIGCFAS